MATEQAKVTIEGTSALLMNRFPLDPVEGMKNKTREEQAEIAAYRTDSGELYVPGIALQRCFIQGAAYTKKGKGSLRKEAAACLQVGPEHISLGQKTYSIDARAVVVKATQGRVVRARPRFDKWELTFTLEWDPVLLSKSAVRKIVDDAGSRVGLLDFRPEKMGPFGRFVVKSWF